MGNIQGKDIKKNKDNAKVIAAIDFGTANTGYAFSVVDKPNEIQTGKFLNKLDDDRVPTIVLLDKEKNLIAFGNDAKKQYTDMDARHQNDCYYLKLFKMELYAKEKFADDAKIYDHTGKKSVDAHYLFSQIIKYIVKLSQEVLKESNSGIWESDVLWMITVPAVWSDSARTFMIDAAKEAGISDDMIRVVCEPEAASLYCRSQLTRITTECSIEELPVGHKYILADLGGGTADICSHEVLKGGELRELYRVSGGNFGGNSVNHEFEQCMIKIVGAPVWTKFQDKSPTCYLDTLDQFENLKGKFTGENDMILKMEPLLIDLSSEGNEETIDKSIRGVPFAKDLEYSVKEYRLKIKKSLAERFFQKSIRGIIDLIKGVVYDSSTGKRGIQSILLVGGYAESQYLRNKIRAEFDKSISIVLEQDPRLAVMKGAVMLGYKPKSILVERKARFTYGFSVTKPFEPKVHPEHLKVKRNGKEYCDDIFEKVIKTGQSVKYGQIFGSQTRECVGADLKGEPIFVALYRTSNESAKYCTETEECVKVGEITMTPPETGWQESVKYSRQIIVGETQLRLKVREMYTNEEYERFIDFAEDE